MTHSSDKRRPEADGFGAQGASAAAKRASFAERVAAEGERRRPGHHEPPPLAAATPFGRRAGDAEGLAARTPHARFIPREEIGSVAAWQPSAFGDKPRQAPVKAAPDPAVVKRQAEQAAQQQAALAAQRAQAEIEARAAELRGAREGGYQDGYRDGLAALEAFKTQHAAQCGAQVAAVVEQLQRQLAEVEQHLAQRVAGIALETARQVVRHELQTHPELVVAVTQEALSVLLVSARHVAVRLNPADHALVANGLAEVLKARGARLVADAGIAAGGCLVDSDIGSVDARIGTRWARASAALGRRSDIAQDASLAPAADDDGAAAASNPNSLPTKTEGAA